MSSDSKTTFDQWAIVELLGHVRMAGRLTEAEHFGCKLGRLDIPSGEGFVTQFFGGQSVYRITACDEATARAVAASNQPQPVHCWEIPQGSALPAPRSYQDDDRDDEDLDDEDVPY